MNIYCGRDEDKQLKAVNEPAAALQFSQLTE